jgi:hypothetical protein
MPASIRNYTCLKSHCPSRKNGGTYKYQTWFLFLFRDSKKPQLLLKSKDSTLWCHRKFYKKLSNLTRFLLLNFSVRHSLQFFKLSKKSLSKQTKFSLWILFTLRNSLKLSFLLEKCTISSYRKRNLKPPNLTPSASCLTTKKLKISWSYASFSTDMSRLENNSLSDWSNWPL